jgi:hypothetical protein
MPNKQKIADLGARLGLNKAQINRIIALPITPHTSDYPTIAGMARRVADRMVHIIEEELVHLRLDTLVSNVRAGAEGKCDLCDKPAKWIMNKDIRVCDKCTRTAAIMISVAEEQRKPKKGFLI